MSKLKYPKALRLEVMEAIENNPPAKIEMWYCNECHIGYDYSRTAWAVLEAIDRYNERERPPSTD